ncbi:MAG: hypothetical protein FWB71_02255 [Defluviitaleaceae bacterium]|nr:hypothetical protein [Defluviitaleaceae bacterium]
MLKIEGAYAKEYWLFVDMAKDKSLTALDKFLREIWLECCGHLSKLSVGKSRKIGTLDIGDQILHEYDFGTTTECLITIMAETRRPKQRAAVRLLARNEPIRIPCSCGEPAEYICNECMWDDKEHIYCEKCADTHEHEDMLIAITNSPRCGECGYDGHLDTYAFDSGRFN